MQCGSIYFRLISWFWGEWNVFSFLTAVNRGLTIIITTLPSQIQTRLLHFEKTFFCSSMMKFISIARSTTSTWKFHYTWFLGQITIHVRQLTSVARAEESWRLKDCDRKKLHQTSPNRLRLQTLDSFLIFTIRTRPKTNLNDDRKFLFAHHYKLVWTGLDWWGP